MSGLFRDDLLIMKHHTNLAYYSLHCFLVYWQQPGLTVVFAVLKLNRTGAYHIIIDHWWQGAVNDLLR